MAGMADVVSGVRNRIRDFPRYFQTEVVGDGATQILELPHVMIEATGLVVQIDEANQSTEVLTAVTDYTLDAEHGDIMLVNRILSATETLTVVGQHYTWFTDGLVEQEAGWYIESIEESVDQDDLFDNLATDDPRFELIVRGTIVGCLWAVYTELSFDIDTRTAEGVDIPASQRFAHVERLIEHWTARYKELAANLNLGVERIQMLTLRRVSLSTGRLVPIYKTQEFDDQATPQRLYPPIDHDQFMSGN
jgi:hypothetical protein